MIASLFDYHGDSLVERGLQTKNHQNSNTWNKWDHWRGKYKHIIVISLICSGGFFCRIAVSNDHQYLIDCVRWFFIVLLAQMMVIFIQQSISKLFFWVVSKSNGQAKLSRFDRVPKKIWAGDPEIRFLRRKKSCRLPFSLASSSSSPFFDECSCFLPDRLVISTIKTSAVRFVAAERCSKKN